MWKFTLSFQRNVFVLLFICLVSANQIKAQAPQNLKITDFAVWGGGAAANPFNNTQGVSLENKVTITGNIGSNHKVDIKGKSNIINGGIYSGNGVVLGNDNTITGNISGNRAGANYPNPVISAGTKLTITGNLTANGMIDIKSGTVTGQVAVPAPSGTNYTGPTPTAGIINNVALPVLPLMPNNTPFDNQVGTTTISNTQTIQPGKYKKLALSGKKTLTLNGPGNYIFYEVDNGSNENEIVFDFKNTTTGTFNIFIIKDARWGNLIVSTKKGNFPARINTEIHGNGSTYAGIAFDLKGSSIKVPNKYAWLGNVWAPNGGIFVGNTKSSPDGSPHIIGALWSGKQVTISDDLILNYLAPAVDPSYIAPYYPPPASGKVDAPNNTIGAELLSLSLNPNPISSIPQNEIFRFNGPDTVMIEVISKAASDVTLQNQLVSLGMTGLINNGPHIYVITGFFPINKLTQLNGNTRIEYVRPLYPPINNVGQVTSQGDVTMRSNNVRERFGLDGSGVKIGVLSDSYNKKLGAQQDVDEGDLPGISGGPVNPNPEPVQVLFELPFNGNDEGRAMLQIVHDVAPKAKLAFRTGFLSAGDFARGIEDLASASLAGGPCDVIVDDITYVTEPFLTDGRVAQSVNQVVSQGVTYFSSAGNFGNRSSDGIFNGITNTSIIPSPGKIHQFGPTPADIYQTVNLKPGSYTIVLQWDEGFHSLGSPGVPTADLDLYLVGSNGFTLFGFNRSNLFGDPFEVCPFTVTEETNAKLMLVSATGTSNVRFKYIIFRGNATIMNYQNIGSTIVGHPNAAGAIAVGAMLYDNIPTVTPVWPGVASFSSRGGTPTRVGGTFTTRNKPELIAPNGVNTTVNLGGAVFDDGDLYPNFFGTSASAPHAAAVAGLLIQGQKKFNLDSVVSPTTIREQLQTSAGKFSHLSGNHSFEGGYGFVQADSAISQIANARPIILALETVVPGAQNGTEPFTVKVIGKYLTSSTEIYFNGEPVETTVSPGNTEATANVPAITNGEDPPIQLYNPPKSPSELDGGLSEALHFFSSITDVTIRAESKSRKYGQSNPEFTTEVLVNGIPISQTNLTLAGLKLDNLSFNTLATTTSNAGLYGIRASRTTPLANNDPLLTTYGFTFVSGTLSVGKMALKITPVNKTVKYGEDLGEIGYTYELEESEATSPELEAQVAALHKKFLADNAVVALSGLNGGGSVISPSDLTNMSVMASFQAIRNARKFVLENGHLTALENNIDPAEIGNQRFIVDASSQSLQNY
ncbi:MAG: S8 family serine peptidase, partial [Chitinophagaceae bacterium]